MRNTLIFIIQIIIIAIFGSLGTAVGGWIGAFVGCVIGAIVACTLDNWTTRDTY